MKWPPAIRCARARRSSAANSPTDDVKRMHGARQSLRATRRRRRCSSRSDRVRAKNINPATHTRLPALSCAGHIGIVERINGCHVFPDSAAHDKAKIRSGFTRWCSRAANSGASDADPTLKVSIEAFEPYLEKA